MASNPLSVLLTLFCVCGDVEEGQETSRRTLKGWNTRMFLCWSFVRYLDFVSEYRWRDIAIEAQKEKEAEVNSLPITRAQ